jgi:ribonuclease P protein component
VLPAAARIRSSAEFTAVLRSGRRAGSRTVVIHALDLEPDAPDGSPHVGFVVSRAVGGAVDRNRVRRRLRHLLRDRLSSLPTASRLVVRALAPAGSASSGALASDVDRCLAQLMGPAR